MAAAILAAYLQLLLLALCSLCTGTCGLIEQGGGFVGFVLGMPMVRATSAAKGSCRWRWR